MATLEEIGTYLQSNGIGTLGTDIFLGLMPEAPANCVALIEYPGGMPTHTFGAGTGAAFEEPRIQVSARNTTYPGARAKIEAVYQLLDKVTQQTLSGTTYHRIMALQSPFGLPLDLNNRHMMAFNVIAQKAVS